MNPQLHGRRARFNHRNNLGLPDLGPQTFESGFNRGWMMSKVIIDSHASILINHFHAALNANKFTQANSRLFKTNADLVGGNNRRQSI